MLAVGRFAFLPMQRRDQEKAVAQAGPKTTGAQQAALSLVSEMPHGESCRYQHSVIAAAVGRGSGV